MTEMYRYRADLHVNIEVEADSEDEAERIIRGVLDSRYATITVHECLDEGDELTNITMVFPPDIVRNYA